MDNRDVPRDQVADLKVSVVSAQVQAAQSDDEFPKWSELKVERDITDGRPAGLGTGDDV